MAIFAVILKLCLTVWLKCEISLVMETQPPSKGLNFMTKLKPWHLFAVHQPKHREKSIKMLMKMKTKAKIKNMT